MRFPRIPPEQRTFNLFNYLGLSNKLIRYMTKTTPFTSMERPLRWP